MECYAEPRDVKDVTECNFYHKTDLAELDNRKSDWDLRHCVDEYLGKTDFQNRRVLDVGTASGFLSFEMEKRGADVVSFDMPTAENWDFVPHFELKKEWDDFFERSMKGHQRLQNAYWYMHKRLNSKAKVHYGDIYQLPEQLGNFDIVFMGMILGHVRDPFQALFSASRLCRSKIIITNQADSKTNWWKKKKRPPSARFMPSRNRDVYAAWWSLSTECLTNMLGTIGFEVVETIGCQPKCLVKNRLGEENCVTIVAERFAGAPVGIDTQAKAA